MVIDSKLFQVKYVLFLELLFCICRIIFQWQVCVSDTAVTSLVFFKNVTE